MTVQVADFRRTPEVLRWRRALARNPPDGAALVKVLSTLGTRGSGGFGLGLPGARRQVVLGVWPDEDTAHAAAADGPLAELRAAAWSWTVTMRAVRAHGSHVGARPIVPSDVASDTGSLAAITLGRARARDVPRFFAHGMPLARPTLEAPGLVTALTAGAPLTGNLTFSLWRDADAMLAFAYGQRGGRRHAATVRSHHRAQILCEQLTARLIPLRIDGAWDTGATAHADRLAALAEDLRREPPRSH